jgi:hypothetical protein
LKDLSIEERIIIEWILEEIRWEVVDWIHLNENASQLRALMNTVINFRGVSSVSERPLTSRGGVWSMQFVSLIELRIRKTN